jgi:hypothetical protein
LHEKQNPDPVPSSMKKAYFTIMKKSFGHLSRNP